MLILILLSRVYVSGQGAEELPSGFAVTFLSDNGTNSDTAVLRNLQLFVPNGESPTPFIPRGRFTAIWNGLMKLDLRGEYGFRVALKGEAKLTVNDKVIIEMKSPGPHTVESESIRLNKGYNTVTLHYRSPSTGEARLGIMWIPNGLHPAPVPSNILFHQPSEREPRASKLRLGRELFIEYRCARCHLSPSRSPGLVELAMDAPAFDGIGSRLNFGWTGQWILDPKSQRSSARMPKVLHGVGARSDAAAVAAFLMSSLDASWVEIEGTRADAATGRQLFDSLRCVACHTDTRASDADPTKISLTHVAQKFRAGALASFLKTPERHYVWIRMPNFKLSDEEASQLAAYLISEAEPGSPSNPPIDASVLLRGQKVVQSAGCLNCHSAKIDNQFKTKSLDELDAMAWNSGCLAEKRRPDEKAPAFEFTDEERAALRAFGATDRNSLSRDVPTEFAERQIRLLNCTGCHGELEGLPPVDLVGAKLKPEWTKALLGGEVPYKPRPWLGVRMPSFTSRAAFLAQGMAAQHGYPPLTAAEPPIDEAAAKVGQRLVSADGGFACIACHAVGQVKATQVFESAGINLAYAEERLLRPYYERWLRNPQEIDPSTKMPVYFDEECKSPLIDYYEGDCSKQIDAIWQYFRLRERMPPPGGAELGP